MMGCSTRVVPHAFHCIKGITRTRVTCSRGQASYCRGFMLIKRTKEIPYSEITPKSAYLNRRTFMTGAAALGVAGLLDPLPSRADATKLHTVKSPLSTSGLTLTSYKDITSYNNFYEFGVEKDNPAEYAGKMKTRPWTVTVDGLVKQKKTVSI